MFRVIITDIYKKDIQPLEKKSEACNCDASGYEPVCYCQTCESEDDEVSGNESDEDTMDEDEASDDENNYTVLRNGTMIPKVSYY